MHSTFQISVFINFIFMKYLVNYCKHSFLLFAAVAVMGLSAQCKGGDEIIPDIEPPIIEKVSKIATTEEGFLSYLGSATPGDTIFVSGTINISSGDIITSKAGRPFGHITIKGINEGILKWTNETNRACLNIKHNYYRISNLTIDANSQSKRGLLIEDANYGMVINVVVRNTLNEGYKIRKNSQYWYFDHCSVYSTGLAGKYGEGFYVGDTDANWTTGESPDKSGYITFNSCFAKRTNADGFDFKEGTHHIKVVNCTVDFEERDVDPVYGNHGVYSRADYVQVINCTIKNNTKGNGNCFWAKQKKAKDGQYYGKGYEMILVAGSNMKNYLYWTDQPDTKLYTDYSISQCAGVKDPDSPENAQSTDPSAFVQMTWEGEGGGIY
jgi:hypothetical protein